MDIRYGVVVATHPEDHSVDLVMVDDHSRLAGVQVLTPNGSGLYGINDLLAPDERTGDAKWDLRQVGAQNPIAGVLFGARMPVVIGFRFPQINQVLFDEKNLRVDRHASEVYSTLNAASDYEMAWPNGTFVRIAADPNHVDLNGHGSDKKWATTKNADKALHLRVVLGAGKLDLHVDPAGNLSIVHDGDLTIHTKGAASIAVDGNTTLTTPKLTVDAPESEFTGHVLVKNGLNVTGNATITGGDVKADAISLKAHKHTGVSAGSATSGPATA